MPPQGCIAKLWLIFLRYGGLSSYYKRAAARDLCPGCNASWVHNWLQETAWGLGSKGYVADVHPALI